CWGGLTRASISPDGERVVTVGPDESGKGGLVARIRKLADGKPEADPFKQPGLKTVAFLPDGRCLALTITQKTLPGRAKETIHDTEVWNVSSGAPVGRTISHSGDF